MLPVLVASSKCTSEHVEKNSVRLRVAIRLIGISPVYGVL